MKKYAITSICTLVLSLLGAFGLNQNSLNSNANSISTDTVENVQYIDDSQNLQDDNQKKAAQVNAGAEEATVNNEASAEQAKLNTQDSNTAVNSNTQNTVSNKQLTDNKLSKTVKTANKINTDNQAKLQATPVASLNTNKCTIKNGQIFFGNINLSNCKSVDDVVKTLNNNGYANVTADNIKNIKSLEDVLNYINKSSGNTAAQGGTSNAPTQAAVNTPTTKPAPTKAPASATTPTKTPTATTAPSTAPANTGISSYASEVLRLVNAERAKAGLPALTTNSTLTAAANKRAQETKQSFSHTRPNGSSAFTVLGEYGISYRTAGENIAYGQKTPQEVVNGWMNSPGHRANILNSSFGKIGIGVYESNGVIYWTQLFTD